MASLASFCLTELYLEREEVMYVIRTLIMKSPFEIFKCTEISSNLLLPGNISRDVEQKYSSGASNQHPIMEWKSSK